jgi:isocitrate/isopropylmalate dehydrogenase
MHHGQMQAGDAIGREIHRMTAIFQVVTQIRRDVAVIFDYENAHVCGYLCLESTGSFPRQEMDYITASINFSQ